jgi:hypothetical protein
MDSNKSPVLNGISFLEILEIKIISQLMSSDSNFWSALSLENRTFNFLFEKSGIYSSVLFQTGQ